MCNLLTFLPLEKNNKNAGNTIFPPLLIGTNPPTIHEHPYGIAGMNKSGKKRYLEEPTNSRTFTLSQRASEIDSH